MVMDNTTKPKLSLELRSNTQKNNQPAEGT